MKLKEPAAGLIHLIGAILTIPALIILIVYGNGSAWKTASFAIYGGSFFLLFVSGTLYHWLPQGAGGKFQIFRKLDHEAIYLVIAGTYTPFCLNTLRGPAGWAIFGIVWGIALFGIIIQSIYINVSRWLTTAIYIIMGWLILFAIDPLVRVMPIPGIILLVIGGVIYSVGGVIYTIKKPNFHPVYGYHELWHTLVLIAAACHYAVILFYIALK